MPGAFTSEAKRAERCIGRSTLYCAGDTAPDTPYHVPGGKLYGGILKAKERKDNASVASVDVCVFLSLLPSVCLILPLR